LAGGQPYCLRCGWNRNVAIANLRQSLKMFPISLIMFFAFAYFFFFRRVRHFDPFAMIVVLAFPAIMLVISYFLMHRAINKLESLPTPTTLSTGGSSDNPDFTSADSAPQSATFEPSAQDQAVLRTSRPREIRMSSQGKFGITASVIFATGMAAVIVLHLYTIWIPTRSFVRFANTDWIALGVAILLALLPYGVWRGQVKECDLLENGEVVLGRVTRQWSGSKGASSIECEFTDYQGQVRTLIATDNSKKLYTGMSVPVFYDRENPNRNIASCATLHEVVT
jgi:hypothetical protein